MVPSPQLRRSVLYVPGNNERALRKAGSLPADVLILDLEDAVGPGAKVSSRQTVLDFVRERGDLRQELVVRINSVGTQWHADDLLDFATSGADAILVPKVETGKGVAELDAALRAAGAPEGLALWAMVETPRAFLRIEEIATASDRLAALVVGTNDLINDIHAVHAPDRAPVLTSLSLAVLGARAGGKVVLDGVFNDISDTDGFLAEARQGRDFGFDGKTVIHPSQVTGANEVFSPSGAEVDYAENVVSAYDAAVAAGESVAVVNGKMIEMLHVRDAQRILALHAAASV